MTIKLCDNCNGMALAQVFLIFVVLYIYETKIQIIEERDGLLLCINEKKDKFIFENVYGFVERVPLNIKGMRKFSFKKNLNNTGSDSSLVNRQTQ